MEVLFSVYCHLNKVNNKRYIGITCQQLKNRWQNGNGYSAKTQPVFAAAIKKYGWENFEHIILFENLTADEAKAKEIELIAYYHTWIGEPDCKGYNMTRGGQGSLKYLTVEEKLAAKAAYKVVRDQAEERYRAKLKADPIAYKNYLKRKAADKARARQNPEIRETTNKRVADCHDRVKLLRNLIIALNQQYPTILTEIEKYNLKAANRCRSIKYLTELYKKFEDYTDGKDTNRRED